MSVLFNRFLTSILNSLLGQNIGESKFKQRLTSKGFSADVIRQAMTQLKEDGALAQKALRTLVSKGFSFTDAQKAIKHVGIQTLKRKNTPGHSRRIKLITLQKDKFVNLTILINTQSLDALSYEQVQAAIAEKQPHIITNCLDFACFDILDAGYEVVVNRWNVNAQNYEFIVLSELLKNSRPYSHRQIRKAHNVQKMIKAGAIVFLPSTSESAED